MRDPINRRDFVRHAGALGLTLGAGLSTGALLGACGGEGSRPAPYTPSGDLGPVEGELNIYSWSDYIARDTVANFEREFGVRVTYDTYESNEEMAAKLAAGAAGYDIVVPSSYIIPAMLAQNLIAPLNQRYLPNRENVAPLFRDPPADPGNAHTVPWLWGVTGLAYRRDKLAAPPRSWAALLDERLRGKLTMLDDGREVIGAMLKYRGHSLNSTNPAELARAKTDAVAAKANLKAYVSAPVKGQLIAGDVWIAQLWNGDAAQAAAEQPDIAFAVPGEGSLIWTDYLVMPAGAPHPRAAHEFMNYILRPSVGAAIADFTGYGSPNRAAQARSKHPVPYPTAEELRRLEYQQDLGAATVVWDQIWTEIKSS